MAMYHIRAEQLKPLIASAGFTAEQLNLVHKMMRSCATLRQGKVITSFLQAMLPDNMELRQGAEVAGKYGPYRPIYVVEKGKELIESVDSQEDAE